MVKEDNALSSKAAIDWRSCLDNCLRLLLPFTILLASGCAAQDNSNNQTDHQISNGSTGGILSSVRPQASPELIAKIRAQEQAAGAKQNANAQGQPSDPLFDGLNGLATRVLPKVSTDPISGSSTGTQKDATDGKQGKNQDNATTQASNGSEAAATATAYSGSYNSYNAVPTPPPGALAGALVPPPPAVTLTTQAQAVGSMPDPNNPYMNPYGYPPYMNPYGMAFPFQSQSQQQQPAAPQPRPSGLFGNGGGKSTSSDSDDIEATSKSRKGENFVPITPTGMEARSAYKQRDDLKILWKGLLSSNHLSGIEPKVMAQLNKLEVGLPSESTKGNFSINQRQVDAIFKSSLSGIDRRVVPEVRKSQADLVQAYSRYLYTYNKFALAQQTVAARKQEIEVASSNAEQQRAAADLAQAQTELDSAKDDMHSAHIELAQASSPASARAVIAKVSGVAPGLETLVAADPGAGDSARKTGIGGLVGSMQSIFTFGRSKPDERQPGQDDEAANSSSAHKGDHKVASQKNEKDKGKAAKIALKDEKSDATPDTKKKEKHADKSQDAKVKVAEDAKKQDLSPAPESSEKEEAQSSDKPETPLANAAPGSQSKAVAFTLKGVNVTTRKSILTVAIKNTGTEAFTFNPDVISVADGNHKLPDAAMRADFDSTLVQPDQEVKGTITIFGRPWNDRLSVSLADGAHSIPLKR